MRKRCLYCNFPLPKDRVEREEKDRYCIELCYFLDKEGSFVESRKEEQALAAHPT